MRGRRFTPEELEAAGQLAFELIGSAEIRALSEKVDRMHEGSPNTHILAPDNRYVGFIVEEEAARLFGVEPDRTVYGRGRGDGGKDLIISIDGRPYKVDAKGSRKPHLGMLVEVEKAPAADIFPFFGFPDLKCWGWASRGVVMQARIVDKTRMGLWSYEVPNRWLRNINDILQRLDR